MIKIFNASQIRKIDACTIKSKSISSIDLMERASLAVFKALLQLVDLKQPIVVIAGAGNNGGDALAIARMLLTRNCITKVYLVDPLNKLSPDCKLNKERLERLIKIEVIRSNDDIPVFSDNSIVIDGLFGSGLNRAIDGVYAQIVRAINASGAEIYSIDIPSGMFTEDNSHNVGEIVNAGHVFSLEFPKLALLLPESDRYCQSLSIVDIDLCEKCIDEEVSDYYYIQQADVKSKLRPLRKFAHKGDFGRAMIVAGSLGKMGAAVLAAKACLRAGVGLLTMHIPRCGIDIMQTSVPEAMVDADLGISCVNGVGQDVARYTIGVGSGVGTSDDTKQMLYDLLQQYSSPMVIDADALNLIASDDKLKALIPPQSILTPHPTEFDRLVGVKSGSGYERLQKARQFANQHNVYVVLKGANTAIISPDTQVYFNSTGNPGMATGGSGDALTGIITSLLAQKYTPLDAAIVGVYVHGLAGDLASQSLSQRSLLPSDLINSIGRAYLLFEK